MPVAPLIGTFPASAASAGYENGINPPCAPLTPRPASKALRTKTTSLESTTQAAMHDSPGLYASTASNQKSSKRSPDTSDTCSARVLPLATTLFSCVSYDQSAHENPP